MKKLTYILISILLLNCKSEKKEVFQEYNGQLVKVEFDDSKTDSTFTGYGGEHYPNGNLKSLSYIKNGIPADTVFFYYENGKVKEKGLVENSLPIGWWTYFNDKGILTEKSEWLILRDSSYKNQSYYFDKTGNIKNEPSSYFELDIPDTLRIGKNLARIKNYETNNYGNEGNLITIIMDNQYSESEIKKDTFSDGTLKPFFGIYAYKTGKLKIKGKIQEQILNKEKEDDSLFTLTLSDHYKYFEKEIYVWDKDKYSESGLRIGNEMKAEYKNNQPQHRIKLIASANLLTKILADSLFGLYLLN
ncbi:MAG TPA: hypothetical protein VKN14_11310 [Flavobacteriaceae bacterium]|nr:hypothetical protein [Flavobacteriaceae bacterium]